MLARPVRRFSGVDRAPRPHRLLALLTPLLVVLISGSIPTVTASDPKALTDDLVLRVNRARVGAGLLPLARAPELDAAAQAHSADMVAHSYLDHTGWDGSEPQQRAEQAGYKVPPQSGWIVVEVISAISGEPQGPVNWWLDEGVQHRPVLLNPRWREIGAGYAEGGEYGNYWTALFGCRPGMLPSVTLDGSTYVPIEQCGDPQSEAAQAAIAALTATPSSSPSPNSSPPPSPSPSPLTPVLTTSPSTPMPTAPPPLALVVNPRLAAAGDSVNVRWSGLVAPQGTDWIGLYRASDSDSAYLNWSYVGCATVPLDARPMGSCNLTLPRTLPPGMYEFRLFRDNAFSRLRTSPPVVVG
jgi:uncharacterized protein YkwD